MLFFTEVLVAEPNTLVRQALANVLMVLVGQLSYSIYLFHLLALAWGEICFGSQRRDELVTSGLLLTELVF